MQAAPSVRWPPCGSERRRRPRSHSCDRQAKHATFSLKPYHWLSSQLHSFRLAPAASDLLYRTPRWNDCSARRQCRRACDAWMKCIRGDSCTCCVSSALSTLPLCWNETIAPAAMLGRLRRTECMPQGWQRQSYCLATLEPCSPAWTRQSQRRQC